MSCQNCYFYPVCDGAVRCRYFTDLREEAADEYAEQDRRIFRELWVQYIRDCERQGLLTLDAEQYES